MAVADDATRACEVANLPYAEDRFARWYEEHSGWLRAACARILRDEASAEDVAQETFLRAWRHQHRFLSDSEVGPWLWAVARNLCMDVHRRDRRLVRLGDNDPACMGGVPAFLDEQDDRLSAVRDALGQLNDRYRRALDLRYFQNARYEEIASLLGVSAIGARTVVMRARRSLLTALRGGELLGGLWGLGVLRKVIEAARRAAAAAGSRPGVVLPLGGEVAAAALAGFLVVGGLVGPDPRPGRAHQSPSTRGSEVPLAPPRLVQPDRVAEGWTTLPNVANEASVVAALADSPPRDRPSDPRIEAHVLAGSDEASGDGVQTTLALPTDQQRASTAQVAIGAIVDPIDGPRSPTMSTLPRAARP